MTRLHTMADRFDNDPQFRAVVDTLVAAILRLDMTPSEVRECAVFACMRAEALSPKPVRISASDADEFIRRMTAVERKDGGR